MIGDQNRLDKMISGSKAFAIELAAMLAILIWLAITRPEARNQYIAICLTVFGLAATSAMRWFSSRGSVAKAKNPRAGLIIVRMCQIAAFVVFFVAIYGMF